MKAIKRILVPTDFSDNARTAFDYALNLAEAMKASIKVVHIYTDSTPEMAIAQISYAGGGKSIAEVNEALANFVDEEMEMADNIATARKVKVEAEVYYGSPVQDIVAMSKTGEFDLIIMGSMGEKNWGELMFGSVSTHVSQKAYCPVLLVPNEVVYEKVNNIVYACDFDHKSFKHVGLVSDVAKTFAANVHLLFVKTVENERTSYEVDVEDMRTVFHTQAPRLTYTSKIITEDDVVEGINQYSKVNYIDMVVAVTKHRRFWDRILHSSKTKEMAIYSELPVLIIKADD